VSSARVRQRSAHAIKLICKKPCLSLSTHREAEWPKDIVAPYRIELDDGTLVYALTDTDDLVRTAEAEPWQKGQVINIFQKNMNPKIEAPWKQKQKLVNAITHEHLTLLA